MAQGQSPLAYYFYVRLEVSYWWGKGCAPRLAKTVKVGTGDGRAFTMETKLGHILYFSLLKNVIYIYIYLCH